jgi:hypothetical protein
MLSTGEDVEADALFKRGWTVSAIARHLGRDRGTIANIWLVAVPLGSDGRRRRMRSDRSLTM